MLERDLQKRATYVKKCKDNAWNRSKRKYLKSLRERHNICCRKKNRPALALGYVVIIKGEELRSETGIYEYQELLLNSSKKMIESCLLLKSDVEKQKQKGQYDIYTQWSYTEIGKFNNCIEANKVNEDDQVQEPKRSKRTTAAIATMKIQDKNEEEQGVPTVEQSLNICFYTQQIGRVCQKLKEPSRTFKGSLHFKMV